jgi:N-acetylmuramoyl-L-alanine amidase
LLTQSNAYATVLTALCAWREARGETLLAQQGVIWVILNRAAKPGWWGKDPISVILAPEQFSSFDENDPNSVKFPSAADGIFPDILNLAVNPGTDPTGGATSYYSGDVVPYWASTMTHTVDIADLHFYR